MVISFEIIRYITIIGSVSKTRSCTSGCLHSVQGVSSSHGEVVTSDEFGLVLDCDTIRVKVLK